MVDIINTYIFQLQNVLVTSYIFLKYIGVREHLWLFCFGRTYKPRDTAIPSHDIMHIRGGGANMRM